jgi:hypothetical protein
MVKMTIAEQQSVLLGYSAYLFQASVALDILEDDPISFDGQSDDDNNDDQDYDDIGEIFELTALEWTRLALAMTDGTRGPYNQFLKSKDFFSTSLQAPD